MKIVAWPNIPPSPSGPSPSGPSPSGMDTQNPAGEASGQNSGTLNSYDRLHKIDILRAKNIGNHLPLPQLVAAGDQSSGKSSLLENLTGIPFPRDEGLCTRYATQITHRREDHSHINISIIPGPTASDDYKERLSSYLKEVQSTAELSAQFPEILDEVNKLMGIRTSRNPTGTKTFTEDVLKIEKCGPDEDYLTIIDVPGIFRNTEEGVVTKDDRSLVRNMVEKYIKDSRTVILAVLSSNQDVSNQEILELAGEYDKTGERTLGILTKPDTLLDSKKAKATICDMVNGKKKPLTLGYYVVRSKGPDEGDDEMSLARREQMFKEDPWCSLPADRVGVNALRVRLQDLLGQITDKSFPLVRKEVRQMLADCQRARDDLGVSRHTTHDQQKYLTAIAGKFQSFVRIALEADYSVHEAFADHDFRLITAVTNITVPFGREFLQSSYVYLFESPEDVAGPDKLTTSALVNQVRALDVDNPLEAGLEEFPELDGLIATDWVKQDPKGGIMPWIESMYCRSRGLDLFTYSSKLPASAFREQSARWEPMTRQYVSEIILVVHRFIMRALDFLFSDKRIFEQVKSCVMDGIDGKDGLLAKYQKGMEQAMFLVNVEREKKPFTLHQDFHRLVDEYRSLLSLTAGINDTAAATKTNGTTKTSNHAGTPPTTHQPPAENKTSKDSKETIKEDIHDKLKVYYQIASERFLDNVFRQAVDHFLLSGPQSPLLVFSEQWVIDLSADRLASIAGEPRAVRETRENLDRKIEDLRGAIRILQ